MFYACLQRTKLQIVHAGFDQRIEPLFEKIEKSELVTAASLMRDIDQRYRNRRWRRCEVGNDFLVTDRFQDVLHRFLKLLEGDDVLVVPQMQIKRDALGDVLGQPPTRIAGLVGRAIDGGVQPIPVELKELTRVATQIWKLFFKRDHDSFDPVEIIRAASSPASRLCPARGWRRQIDRHLRSADGLRRNGDTPLHRSRAICRGPLHRYRSIELRGRRFPDRARCHRRVAPRSTNWWNVSRKLWRCCRRVCVDRTARGCDRASPRASPSARFLLKW